MNGAFCPEVLEMVHIALNLEMIQMSMRNEGGGRSREEGKSILCRRPMYLTAGNFPSKAANTIQVAKMAAAYTRWLPNLEVVALTGPFALLFNSHVDLIRMFGLSRPLNMRYLPLLWSQTQQMFNQDYRPPRWFYRLVGQYAHLRGADLVFTRKPETAVVTVGAGIDTVLETHILWENMPQLHPYQEILRKPALRALVVVTSSLVDSFARAGIQRERILVEPDGVDLAQYTPILEQSVARKQLGLKQDVFLCVYTGHLYRDRGIEVIIETACRLPAVQFLLVGGWEKDVVYYRHLVASCGAVNVNFTGFVPHNQIPLYQFAADVLLMQYSAKTHHAAVCSPLKLFEYLAAGRPIVSVDLIVLRSILRNGQNALMIESDSVPALEAAIRQIMDNPGLAGKLGRSARNDSMQYSWEARARRILTHALGGN